MKLSRVFTRGLTVFSAALTFASGSFARSLESNLDTPVFIKVAPNFEATSPSLNDLQIEMGIDENTRLGLTTLAAVNAVDETNKDLVTKKFKMHLGATTSYYFSGHMNNSGFVKGALVYGRETADTVLAGYKVKTNAVDSGSFIGSAGYQWAPIENVSLEMALGGDFTAAFSGKAGAYKNELTVKPTGEFTVGLVI